MYYLETTADDLMKLREGLSLLERLNRDLVSGLDLYVYGITRSPAILDACREAIAANGEEEIDEESIQLTEVAVALQASPDILYYLTGSGAKLGRGDEFVYQGEAGEGIRKLDFSLSRVRTAVTMEDFQHLALAESNVWLDKFLTQYGTKTPVEIRKEVKRTEPAVPVETEAPVMPTPVAKQTSVLGAKQLRDILENFLG
jgi:hypothetical protein